jgi:hypothetical protein
MAPPILPVAIRTPSTAPATALRDAWGAGEVQKRGNRDIETSCNTSTLAVDELPSRLLKNGYVQERPLLNVKFDPNGLTIKW